MKQSFEEYLMEYVCRTEPCTDDLLPEIYADWLEQVDVELIIELAEKWHKEQLKQQYLQGAKDMWATIDAGLVDGLSESIVENRTYPSYSEAQVVAFNKAQQFLDSLEGNK